jgi:hypothetical protein
MNILLKFVTPVLALIIAAYFDVVRDAPISAAYMAAAAILALVVRDAVETACITYFALHQSVETANTAPEHSPSDPYQDYCDRLAAQDWLDDQADYWLDEYAQLPFCKANGCGKKRELCLEHAYLNNDGLRQEYVTHQQDFRPTPFDEIPGKPLD